MTNNKLPKIFTNPEIKKINNNTKVFCSFYEERKQESKNQEEQKEEINLSSNNYYDTLDRLLNNHSFVFNVPVEIETKEGIIYTKIVSKIDDHILTSDSKIIKLEEIINIKRKGR